MRIFQTGFKCQNAITQKLSSVKYYEIALKWIKYYLLSTSSFFNIVFLLFKLKIKRNEEE